MPTCFGFGSPNPPKSRLGGVLGASWSVLGSLGASWGRLGGILERLGASKSRLGSSWKRLGGVLGRLGGAWRGATPSDVPTRGRPEPVGRGLGEGNKPSPWIGGLEGL